MLAFLKLTRPLNLLIVALTMFVMWWGLLRTLTHVNGLALQLAEWQFICLMLSVVLITAGGNVINDYFDQQIDKVNKPSKVIVGRFVKRRIAMGGHIVLSGVGILLGALVAVSIGRPTYVLVFPVAVAVLWFYSTRFKRTFLLGNIVVAIMTALVPLLVGLFEIPLLQRAHIDELLITQSVEDIIAYFTGLWYWIIAYAAFAFVSTLVRELQKDMADVPGDKVAGCNTAPIVLGYGVSRGLSLAQHMVLVVGLLVIRKVLPDDGFSYYYIGILVILPILLSAGITMTATSRKRFVLAGRVMKFAMITAVLYAFVLSNAIQ
jgi:4-hydroxybenzoate polyprenyltransferase